MELSHGDKEALQGDQDIQELLKQYAREGVQGHGSSTNILDSSFMRTSPQGEGMLEEALNEWQEEW